jgi:polysaccharide export outer membrane protein
MAMGTAPRGADAAGAPSRRALLAGLGCAALAGGFSGALPRGALAQGFRVRPGDQLRVEVLEDQGLNRSVLVLPDGTIDFPLAGTVQAAGRTVDELRRALIQALAPNFADAPTVFVSVGALRPEEELPPPAEAEGPTIDVFVTGEIADPGRRAVPPGTTILQIIAEAGGLTRFAAERRIQLRRADPRTGAVTTYLYDYDATGRRPSIRGGTPLGHGDVVVVPERRLFEF